MAGEEAAVGAALAGVGIVFLLVMMVFLTIMVLAILLFVFWILMIVDAAKRKFKSDGEKTAWILVVVLAGALGAIIYYFVVKRPNKH